MALHRILGRCGRAGRALLQRRLSSTAAADATHATHSQAEMERLGALLARDRRAGDVIFLRGDLGCGKTCFARGFIRAYAQDETLQVTSPTYLLVNTYDEAVGKPAVFHVDLYRLEDVTEQDTVALGLAEAFTQGIALVEWPERFAPESVPSERLDVQISYDEADAELRHIELKPFGSRWTSLVAKGLMTET